MNNEKYVKTLISKISELSLQCKAYEKILSKDNVEGRKILNILSNQIIALESEAIDYIESCDESDCKMPLSKREYELLTYVAKGLYNKEIAYKLDISEKTVQFHLKSIFKKLEVKSRTEAVTKSIQNNWIKI